MPFPWTMVLPLAVLLLVPPSAAAADLPALSTSPGPNADIDAVRILSRPDHGEVRGALRLLPDPLPHSDVGRIVVETVVDGRTVMTRDAATWRVITADHRARVFGFRATLPGPVPSTAVLHVRRLTRP